MAKPAPTSVRLDQEDLVRLNELCLRLDRKQTEIICYAVRLLYKEVRARGTAFVADELATSAVSLEDIARFNESPSGKKQSK
jgi:hypothetical protein